MNVPQISISIGFNRSAKLLPTSWLSHLQFNNHLLLFISEGFLLQVWPQVIHIPQPAALSAAVHEFGFHGDAACNDAQTRLRTGLVRAQIIAYELAAMMPMVNQGKRVWVSAEKLSSCHKSLHCYILSEPEKGNPSGVQKLKA